MKNMPPINLWCQMLQKLFEGLFCQICPQILQNAAIFGSVEGGFSVFDRNRSARETAARGVDGLLFEIIIIMKIYIPPFQRFAHNT